MRPFTTPSKARQALRFVLSVGAPVIALSAVVLVPVLTGAACPSGASAAPDMTDSAGSRATVGSTSPIRLSRLIGSAVSGTDRKRAGTVNDVLLDRAGRITAVILDVGAFLGVHTRTVAVPVDRLRLVSGAEAAASPVPSPRFASGTDDDASVTIMEDLMSGNERAWQVGPVDHIEVRLTRKELGNLPSYAGD